MNGAIMKPVYALTFTLVLLWTAITHAEFPRDVLLETLPNGLQVAVKEYHNAPVVSLKFYVKVGAVYEEEYLGCGMSHYLEHLVMEGTTPTRTEAESRQILNSIGAQENAYTTKDHTCYHIDCLSSEWENAVELLSDWVMNCALDSNEVAREHGVITREINMGEDEPGRVVYKLLMNTVFPEAPIGIPTIGYRENYARMTHEDVTRFHEKYYVPNNTIVSIVGDVDRDEVMAKVKQLMGGWEREPLYTASLPTEPEQVAPRMAYKEWPGEVAYLRIAWPTIHLSHPDLYPLDLLAGVLGNGESSLLSRAIKDELGLAYDIGAYSFTPHYSKGVFVVNAVVPGDQVEDAVNAVKAEIEKLRTAPPDEDEIRRAKQKIIADYTFGLQSADALAASIGRDLVGTNDPYFSFRYTERIADVETSELLTMARRYLLPERINIICLGPESPNLDSDIEAKHASVSDVSRHMLPNGLRILTKENANVGVVSIYVAFLGGNRYETKETNGLFSLMVRSILRGTKKHNGEEIHSMVESRGGTIEAGSTKDKFWLRIDLLAEDVDFGLDLMGELLTQATFPEEEVEKERRELLADWKQQDDNWQYEATKFFLASYFDNHPYGFDQLGSPDVIEKLNVDDLKHAYESFIRTESGVVSVFGNIVAEEIVDRARSAFESVTTGSAPLPEDVEIPVHTEFHSVSKTNEKGQVTVCLGYPAPALGSEDECPIRIMDAISSGIGLPHGWFHEALRGRNDLVYFVHLIPWYMKDAGAMYVMTQCQPDLVDSVLGLIKHEYARALAGEFSEEAVASAKIENAAARNLYTQDMAEQANLYASYELYDLGFEMAGALEERMKNIAVPDVQAAAQRYLSSNAVLTLIGPLEEEDNISER